MYNKLKVSLAMTTILFIAFIGFIFIKDNQSEMFGGYKEVVTVVQSTVNIKDQLEQIALESDSVLARRIIDSTDNSTGELQNTFIPIGANTLPDKLHLQTDQEIIENSPYNTLYVVTKGKLTGQILADKLNIAGNKVSVFPTKYRLVLLRLMFATPQSFMIVIVLLIAFSSLILAEYISNIKSIGIRRLAGEGKHQIALNSTFKDSKYLFFYTALIICIVTILLMVYELFSVEGLLIIILPLLLWLSLLLMINFFLSNIFYYILQSQPLILSIKGKAPLHTIIFIVFVVQLLTLISLIYSIHGLINVNYDLTLLKDGQNKWSEHKDFFQMSSIDNGNTVTKYQLIDFYEELQDLVDVIAVNTNVDNIALSNSSQIDTYGPNAYQTENVIYVNQNFISHDEIQLPTKTLELLSKLKPFDSLILIPRSKENDFESLKKSWSNRIKSSADGAMDYMGSSEEPTILTAMYEGGKEIFVYPIFNEGGQLLSNNSMVHHPIIVVGNLYSNVRMFPDAWNIRISEPDKVITLIKEKKLTHAFGSLTNGYYSINERINLTRKKQGILLISTGVNIICSILLLSLLNTVYFYQGRKVFFIERLSGKNYISIHKIYLITVFSCISIITIICVILNLNYLITITPTIYMLLVVILFLIQLKRERKTNVQYLKGE